jgi:hypothetical protein
VAGASEDISSADESDFVVDLLEDGFYSEITDLSTELTS